MKKVLVLMALLFCWQGFAQVSPHPYRGTISTAGTDCSTATNCVSVTIPPETASVTIAVDADTGSWSGTIQFEGSVSGATWIAMVPTSNSSSQSSSTTATGSWQFNPSSYTQIRARASARVSGTAGIVINWSNATASSGGTRLNPLGAANDLACILGVNVLGPCDTGNATYSSSTLSVPNATVSGSLTVTGAANIAGALCSGVGQATSGSPALYTAIKQSGTNWVATTTGDSTNPGVNVVAADHTICPTFTSGNIATAQPGQAVTVMADLIGLTANHYFGPSPTTAATFVDLGTDLSALSPTTVYCGTVQTTTAASGNAPVIWNGCKNASAEHVITFNLIKSGAVGVFPVVDFACTIYRVDVTADQSGTFAMDVWRANAAIPTGAGAQKISGTSWTPLSGAQSSFNTSLSGWTSSGAIPVSVGDVFGGTIPTFTTVTNVLVQIRCH